MLSLFCFCCQVDFAWFKAKALTIWLSKIKLKVGKGLFELKMPLYKKDFNLLCSKSSDDTILFVSKTHWDQLKLSFVALTEPTNVGSSPPIILIKKSSQTWELLMADRERIINCQQFIPHVIRDQLKLSFVALTEPTNAGSFPPVILIKKALFRELLMADRVGL